MCLSWRKCVIIGVGYEVSKVRARPSVTLFLLSMDLAVEFSVLPAPCLPAWYHASCHDKNGLNPWTVSQLQLNVILYRVALVTVSLHSNRTWTKTSGYPSLSSFQTLGPGKMRRPRIKQWPHTWALVPPVNHCFILGLTSSWALSVWLHA